MKLAPEQREQVDREGYLFFPALFSREETKVLTDAVPELYARGDICNVRERRIRTQSRPTLPRIFTACRSPSWSAHREWSIRCAICSTKTCTCISCKMNGKMAFEGDVWQWHQDYMAPG